MCYYYTYFFFIKKKFPSSLTKITRCITQLLHKRFMLDDDFLTRYQSSRVRVGRDRDASQRVDARAIYTRGFARATRRRR